MLDWGIALQLRVLTAERLPLVEAPLPQGATYESRQFEGPLANPKALFVGRAPGEPVAFPQIAAGFRQLAEARGYGVQVLETVRDFHGRPVFEILAARPAAVPPSPPDRAR